MSQRQNADESKQIARTGLAVVAVTVSVLLTTLMGAYAEARWPGIAGPFVTLTSREPDDTVATLWELRRIDGVREAVAVLQGRLAPDDIKGTAWGSALFYANQTDNADLAFLPPDPRLRLHRGHLPDMYSTDDAVLGYELAQALHLAVGDVMTIHEQPFLIAGIWGPSAHLPGNFVQISAVAVDTLRPSVLIDAHRFVVLPQEGRNPTEVAAEIWRKMPNVDVVSPVWESARVRQEHAALLLTLAGAVVLAFLLDVPLLASLDPGSDAQAWPVALVPALAGLLVGWGVTVLCNLYAQQTLGLSPLRVTLRLILLNLAAAVGIGLLAGQLRGRWPWAVRLAVAVLALALCGAGMVTFGALNESLSAALSEAQRTAADWVGLPGAQATGALLRDVGRLPGLRGYTIEAYGGLANEDEEGWVGPWPASGVFYGTRSVEGGGSLSIPYPVQFWLGGPLDPDKPNEAVIGYDLARAQGLGVGDTVIVRGVAFTVAGVRSRLSLDPESDVNYRIDITLDALRRVLHDPFASGEITLLIPPSRTQQEKSVYLEEVGTRLNVGQVLTVPKRLAEIALAFPATWSLRPASEEAIVRHARALYMAIWVLCSVPLLAAGALAVRGAMLDRLAKDADRMALFRALGSDEGMLLGDYLQTASLLGLAGALLGVPAGWALSVALSTLGSARSIELLFTPRLGATVFFFLVLTSMAAALAPTGRAVREDATWTLYRSATT